MPSTHLSLPFHVVFSTKLREARIATEWRDRLHANLGGVARNSGAVPEIVGGVADHVHLLLGLTATARLADVVRDIKAVSSKWVHEETGGRVFAWQEGYGAFTSVRPTARASAATSPGKRSIIASGRSKRSIWNSCIGAASISTNAICGDVHHSAAPSGAE